MSKNIVRIEGMENRRVIDFVKHSLRFGLPDLDFEAPSEGNFGAQNAQNIVFHNVLDIFELGVVSKPCFLQHSVGSPQKCRKNGPRGR